jgi:hypothetical protein
MQTTWLVGSWWVPILVWSLIYISDYTFSIYNARLYHKGADRHYEFEGSLELTPQFQDDIDNLRWFSPRFIRALLLSDIMLGAVWWLTTMWSDWPEVFQFVLGGMLLLEAVVHLRHLRVLVLFNQLANGQGVDGKIYQTRRFGYQGSGWEFITFAGLWLLLGLITKSWFILGGSFLTTITGVQHLRWGRAD